MAALDDLEEVTSRRLRSVVTYPVAMEKAELRFLVQEVDFQSPFPFGDEGFQDDWWHSNIGPVGDDTLGGTQYAQLLLDGVEMGRARLTDWQLSDS